MIECVCSFEEEYGFLKSETMSIVSELIRCKDCKYFTRDSITGVTIPGTEYCIFTMNNRIEENDFCSRAERKEE